MTTRIINWQSALLSFMSDRASTPFEWGVQDCALLAADAVMVMTGDDLASEFRGRYATARGSARVLSKLGFSGLDMAVDAKLSRVELNYAQRGDVVLFDGDNGPTLGIYFNGGIFSAGATGSVFLDEASDKIQVVWRV